MLQAQSQGKFSQAFVFNASKAPIVVGYPGATQRHAAMNSAQPRARFAPPSMNANSSRQGALAAASKGQGNLPPAMSSLSKQVAGSNAFFSGPQRMPALNAARFGGAQMSLSSNDYSAFTQASTQSNFGAQIGVQSQSALTSQPAGGYMTNFANKMGFFGARGFKTRCEPPKAKASDDDEAIMQDYTITGAQKMAREHWDAVEKANGELVMLVDEHNDLILDTKGNPTGATRQDVVDNKLWHRCSCVFVVDEEGNYYVQKRSMSKLYYPGYHDLVSGGVMDLQDKSDNFENARRELSEELGLQNPQLEFIKTSKYEGKDGHKFFCNIYVAQIPSTTKLDLQAEEVWSVQKMKFSEIKKAIADPYRAYFTPDSIHCFKCVQNYLDTDKNMFEALDVVNDEEVPFDNQKKSRGNLQGVWMAGTVLDDMTATVCDSPLYKQAFNQPGDEDYKPSIEKVEKLANAIVEKLEFDSGWIDNKVQRERVLTYYLPIALWLEKQVKVGKTPELNTGYYGPGAICVGLSIPQGGGKTTISDCLEYALLQMGIRTGVVSYDDFYLTHEDQQKVASENPDNKFLQGRGTAGTHDMKLGEETIENMVESLDVIEIPRYDKSAFGGKGDRLERDEWMKMNGPLDLVIVEGWMLGFSPVSEDHKVIKENPGMDKVNKALAEYYVWENKFDAAILVGVEDSNIVFNWREQAEKMRRDIGEGAMSVEEVKNFCSRFLPSYDAYSEELFSKGMVTSNVGLDRTLQFKLDNSRTPVIDKN